MGLLTIILILVLSNLIIYFFFLRRFINFQLIDKGNLKIIRTNRILILLFSVVLIIQYIYFEVFAETLFFFLIVSSIVNLFFSIKMNKASKEYLFFVNNLIFGIVTLIILLIY
ncbi:hypothetical protein A0U40_07395 [[Bacillus] sp. KCTC 13219]|nr:hypothetical protein A0U40_07395 [[Bacillus] sp. KCTC 13219]